MNDFLNFWWNIIFPLFGIKISVISFKRVVFPDPLGPFMSTFYPLKIFKFISSRTNLLLKPLKEILSMYFFDTFSNDIIKLFIQVI